MNVIVGKNRVQELQQWGSHVRYKAEAEDEQSIMGYAEVGRDFAEE
jgi:hypothetical protein